VKININDVVYKMCGGLYKMCDGMYKVYGGFYKLCGGLYKLCGGLMCLRGRNRENLFCTRLWNFGLHKTGLIFGLLCNDQLLNVVVFPLRTADGKNYAVILRSVTAVR